MTWKDKCFLFAMLTALSIISALLLVLVWQASNDSETTASASTCGDVPVARFVSDAPPLINPMGSTTLFSVEITGAREDLRVEYLEMTLGRESGFNRGIAPYRPCDVFACTDGALALRVNGTRTVAIHALNAETPGNMLTFAPALNPNERIVIPACTRVQFELVGSVRDPRAYGQYHIHLSTLTLRGAHTMTKFADWPMTAPLIVVTER